MKNDDIITCGCQEGYTWKFTKDSRLICLRCGEEWRDETGNNAVLVLLQEVDNLEQIVKKHVGYLWKKGEDKFTVLEKI